MSNRHRKTPWRSYKGILNHKRNIRINFSQYPSYALSLNDLTIQKNYKDDGLAMKPNTI